jgi:hypothetical protein
VPVSGDHEHDPLLDELRGLFAKDDPVPPLVTQTAKAALGWRRLDADLAELLSGSTLEDESLALARGAGATLRSMSFSSGPLTIDIEIHGESDLADRAVLGQLSPPARTTIEVQTAEQWTPTEIHSDEFGRFRIKLPQTIAFRVRVAVGGGDPAAPNWVETSWIGL